MFTEARGPGTWHMAQEQQSLYLWPWLPGSGGYVVPCWYTGMIGIIRILFIVSGQHTYYIFVWLYCSCIQYREVCSFGRIINIYLDELCTRHVNVQKYVYLVYAELLWKLMLYNYGQLSESEGHFEYFNDRKVIWESFKENGKLTTIISDLTEKLQEIQQNANNKKR